MKMIITFMFLITSAAHAEGIYTTEDAGDAECVPVHVTQDPSVRYDVTSEQWQDAPLVKTNNAANIAMNFRIPPSRINNKAFQRHIGTSEVFVGGYVTDGNQDALSVFGNTSTTQPSQECPN